MKNKTNTPTLKVEGERWEDKMWDIFNDWIEVTGVIPKGVGYYYELEGVIEDMLKIHHSHLLSTLGRRMREEIKMIDFPLAWELVRETTMENHHEKCSYRTSKGGFICDCAVLEGLQILHKKYQDRLTALLSSMEEKV